MVLEIAWADVGDAFQQDIAEISRPRLRAHQMDLT